MYLARMAYKSTSFVQLKKHANQLKESNEKRNTVRETQDEGALCIAYMGLKCSPYGFCNDTP